LKRNIFSLLDHHHAPKADTSVPPGVDKEADKAIQEAEDTKVQLMGLNMGLVEFNWKAEVARAAKAEQQQEQQWLAEEQAEKDWCVEAEEKATREWQEQLAELAWINKEVSLSISEFSFLT